MQDPIVMAWRCIYDAFYSRNHFTLLWCLTKYSRGLDAIAGGYHLIGLRASARPNATLPALTPHGATTEHRQLYLSQI